MFKWLFHRSRPRTALNKDIALKMLVEVTHIFRTLGKTMWLSDGTLLGFYREGAFLGHDLDIDIGCPIEVYDERIAQALQDNGWMLKRTFGEPVCGLEQTWVKDEVFVDIFYFYREKGKVWYGTWWRNKETKRRYLIKNIFEPFDVIEKEYLGHMFPVPSDEESFIVQKYGEDWRTPRTKWDWATDPCNAVLTDIWRKL